MVIPRQKIEIFRDTFLNNFRANNFRYSTLYHFKLLFRFAVLCHEGRPLSHNWDTDMDPFILKNEKITDKDRRILMPSTWVVSALHCEKLQKRRQLCEQGDLETAFGNFCDFPPFVSRD